MTTQDLVETAVQPVSVGKDTALLSTDNSAFSQLLDTTKFEHLWRVSQMFAKSKLIPQHFQNAPHDCFVAIQMAMRLSVEPMMFMQNTFVVHGKPGMEAKLAIALVNRRGPFKDPIDYEYSGQGDTRSCTAYGHLKTSGARREHTISIEMAKKEGWYAQNPKWKNLTDLMLAYRSAMFLCRLYAPECLLGMQTVDELEDIGRIRVESASRTTNIMSRLESVNPVSGEIEEAPVPQERPDPVIPQDAAEEPDPPKKKRRRRKTEPAPAVSPGHQATYDAEVQNVELQMQPYEFTIIKFTEKWDLSNDEAASRLELSARSMFQSQLKDLDQAQIDQMDEAINDETILPFGTAAKTTAKV